MQSAASVQPYASSIHVTATTPVTGFSSSPPREVDQRTQKAAKGLAMLKEADQFVRENATLPLIKHLPVDDSTSRLLAVGERKATQSDFENSFVGYIHALSVGLDDSLLKMRGKHTTRDQREHDIHRIEQIQSRLHGLLIEYPCQFSGVQSSDDLGARLIEVKSGIAQCLADMEDGSSVLQMVRSIPTMQFFQDMELLLSCFQQKKHIEMQSSVVGEAVFSRDIIELTHKFISIGDIQTALTMAFTFSSIYKTDPLGQQVIAGLIAQSVSEKAHYAVPAFFLIHSIVPFEKRQQYWDHISNMLISSPHMFEKNIHAYEVRELESRTLSEKALCLLDQAWLYIAKGDVDFAMRQVEFFDRHNRLNVPEVQMAMRTTKFKERDFILEYCIDRFCSLDRYQEVVDAALKLSDRKLSMMGRRVFDRLMAAGEVSLAFVFKKSWAKRA